MASSGGGAILVPATLLEERVVSFGTFTMLRGNHNYLSEVFVSRVVIPNNGDIFVEFVDSDTSRILSCAPDSSVDL